MNKKHFSCAECPVTLGEIYTDCVTGFAGTATGMTHWLTGCTTVGLTPTVDKDGKPREVEWFDITRIIADPVHAEATQESKKRKAAISGGPQPIPKER